MWISELSIGSGLGQTPKDVDKEDVHVFYVRIYRAGCLGLAVRS